MPSWNWDEEASANGVVHQNTTNTDHTDATKLKQGYDYANFSEITPTPTDCFPLHENSGSTVFNLGGGSDGSVVGSTQGATGILSTTSYDNDGVDDYIDTTNNISLTDENATKSISMWINTTTTDSQTSYGGAFDGNTPFIFIQHDRDGSGDVGGVEFAIRDDNSNVNRVKTQKDLVNDGNWHFIVCTKGTGTSASEMTIYVDAVDETTRIDEDDGFNTGTNPNASFFVAARNNNGTAERFMDIKVTDVRFYDDELSLPEVESLYDVVDTTGEWVGNGKLL
jgi:hypothetical protein